MDEPMGDARTEAGSPDSVDRTQATIVGNADQIGLGAFAGGAFLEKGGQSGETENALSPEGEAPGRIDQYVLLRQLGGGGFGVVYLARDTVAGIDVAVKGLQPVVKNNAEELERIRENFALVSKLHHPHIAAALHLHPAQEVRYSREFVRQALRVLPGDTLLVMTYAPGVTLSKWRRRFPEGKVPVLQALEVCRQIASALDYAHGEKVVHRDVKPSNVMVETREKRQEVGDGDRAAGGAGRPPLGLAVRVLDFGLAAEIRSSMSRVSQEMNDTSGTRPYMAPEQWLGRTQDGRTDQYALAVLFYELVSGAVPFASVFETGDPAIMMMTVEKARPESLPCLSKRQNAALLRALSKNPAKRFASCGEFIGALRERKSARRRVLAASAALAVLSSLCFKRFSPVSNRPADKHEPSVSIEKHADEAGGRDAANKLYEAAASFREKTRGLDRGQRFVSRLDALDVAWREAEAARQGGRWEQALKGYGAVIETCKMLNELEGSRERAKTRRKEAEAAKVYAASEKRASDARAYRKAKDDYLAALPGDAERLTKYRGPKWSEVTKLQWIGEASQGEPSDGARAYAAAREALKGAVSEARDNERAAKLNAALAAAREAKAAGAWRDCVARADEALALDAANGEAATLKAAAQQGLTPSLTVVVEAGGREVAAAISDGRETFVTPKTFMLRKGADYAFTVSRKSSSPSVCYTDKPLALKVDWNGPRIERVTLDEVRLPAEGEPWVSPSTGMEFVWVPALGVWVGKCEVSNGDYRKKEPSHDSKSYEGRSLNGDGQPVAQVNFDDAKAYAAWLTGRDGGRLGGLSYRVPTEAEWQTFAQCGDRREYPWGNQWPPPSGKAGNYSDSASAWSGRIAEYTDGFPVTCPVERGGRNEWGLCGVGGNVWECCAKDKDGVSFGAWRGGAWSSDGPVYLRCGFRIDVGGSERASYNGFRLVLGKSAQGHRR